MLHLSNPKMIIFPKKQDCPQVSEVCFQMKLFGMQEKEMCFPLRQLVLFCIAIIIKKSHLRGKIWFSDIRFNDSENQIHRGVYLLASLLGPLSFLLQPWKQWLTYSPLASLLYILLKPCLFPLSPILSVRSKDSTAQAEIIAPCQS